MWKIKVNKETLESNISIDQAIQLVGAYDGMFLFTSKNTYFNSQLNILGINPVIKIFPDKIKFGNKELKANCLESIDNILRMNKTTNFQPFLMGYFGFDFKSNVEEKGLFQNLTHKSFPLSYHTIFEHYFIFDTSIKQFSRHTLSFPFKYQTVKIKLASKKLISNEIKKSNYSGTNKNKEQYCRDVQQIKYLIKKGDIYQVNLTRQIEGKTEYSFQEIAKKLYHSNAIEFGVIAKINNNYIISTSPERFFKIKKNRILTSPIKGTIKKTKDRNENKKLINELLNDDKELSELAMIVDLLRNDIGKICDYNSVKVRAYPVIKELENVFHLVADIEGKLSEKSVEKIIKAMFPGGSISGCPKIKACQIIEKIEKIGRGPYTGSFGYFSFNGDMDFNILIRTLFLKNESFWFNVGGGITLKSIPEKEYEETIHKASSIWEAINLPYIKEERYCIK